MKIVNLKFQIREKANKKISQAIDKFFAVSQENSTLESVLRNAVTDLEFQSGITSEQVLGRLSKL